MSEIETGGPAFPCMPPQYAGTGCATGYPYPEAGMTLRDYFAAACLQGYIAGFAHTQKNGINPDMQDAIAGGMYSMADAMLKARMK